MDKRVKFDFEIDFSNGGGIQGGGRARHPPIVPPVGATPGRRGAKVLRMAHPSLARGECSAD